MFSQLISDIDETVSLNFNGELKNKVYVCSPGLICTKLYVSSFIKTDFINLSFSNAKKFFTLNWFANFITSSGLSDLNFSSALSIVPINMTFVSSSELQQNRFTVSTSSDEK